MARWWTSMWLANVLAQGRIARAQRAGRDGGGPRLRRHGPLALGTLMITALAVVTLAFVFIWRRVGTQP